MKAITLHSILPVREAASEAAEQGTQMLFGETAEVLAEQPRWLKIKAESDGYEGWVDKKMMILLNDDEYQQVRQAYQPTTWRVKLPVAFALSLGDMKTIPLAAGTPLPNYENGSFEILGAKFKIEPQAVCKPLAFSDEQFMEIVRYFLNCPYLWGGKNMFGIDCSGLTQVLFSLFGIQLPRQAREQVSIGETINFLSEAQMGDLAFFDHGDNGNIIHVGILLDDKRILHASGRVKIEPIDPNGIINTETGKYSHQLRTIKRIVNN